MKSLQVKKKWLPLQSQSKERVVLIKNGAIAQLVEQRTENPCVPGSIPGGTTESLSRSNSIEAFSYCGMCCSKIKMIVSSWNSF